MHVGINSTISNLNTDFKTYSKYKKKQHVQADNTKYDNKTSINSNKKKLFELIIILSRKIMSISFDHKEFTF